MYVNVDIYNISINKRLFLQLMLWLDCNTSRDVFYLKPEREEEQIYLIFANLNAISALTL